MKGTGLEERGAGKNIFKIFFAHAGDTREFSVPSGRHTKARRLAESRSATKSAPPLLRQKASPSREALSRPYPSGLGKAPGHETGLRPDTNFHENTARFGTTSICEEKTQILNYLRITKSKLGLLINFGSYPRVTIERFAL